MQSAVIVENDLFGIAARLRSIDDGYFVVYDKRKHAFEVHNSRQRGNTFALSVPYPCLDVRTERLVRRTRVENAKRLLEEMERENRRREQALRREQMQKIYKELP
ncbi:MAG: hypothetical protein HFE46_03570 [Clostridia bacterium]|nr:hypothetical protein [Clostridia bacterium]